MFQLTAGVKTPFRVLFGNDQGFGPHLQVDLVRPSGIKLIDNGSLNPDYVVQHGCTGDSSAPDFAAFGSEM